MRARRESPIKRVNPSGQTVWMARWTDRHGKRHKAGTFRRKHEAQAAIDAAYASEATGAPETFGAYADGWTGRHPRSARTNVTNACRVGRVLAVELEGRPLANWPFRDLRRRHAVDLVAVLLIDQRRAPTGAQNVLRTLSAMAEDAIADDIAETNWVRGVSVHSNDPRAVKTSRAPRVLTFEQMRDFATHARSREPAVRCLSDCGLRLGELLGLARTDLDDDRLSVRGTAHNGRFAPGDKPTKRHVRAVPVPPSLLELLRAAPRRIDTTILFPTPSGRIWWERNFYRDVWQPARKASGLDCTPQDFRHSWVTHLRAAGIDPADLAEIAGHTVETATARYTHPLRRSDDAVRRVVG